MGTRKGMAKAMQKAIVNNPDFLIERASKGGKSVKRENRPFYKNRALARRAGKIGGKVSKKGK